MCKRQQYHTPVNSSHDCTVLRLGAACPLSLLAAVRLPGLTPGTRKIGSSTSLERVRERRQSAWDLRSRKKSLT